MARRIRERVGDTGVTFNAERRVIVDVRAGTAVAVLQTACCAFHVGMHAVKQGHKPRYHCWIEPAPKSASKIIEHDGGTPSTVFRRESPPRAALEPPRAPVGDKIRGECCRA